MMHLLDVIRIYAEEEDYRGKHTAPSKEDSPLYDVTLNETYPEDFYDSPKKAQHYYGSGSEYDAECVNLIFSYRNRPNALITIYRSVPDNNADTKKQIKVISDLIRYHQKYGFYPVRNQLIDELVGKYPIETYTYDEQQKQVGRELQTKLDELNHEKKPVLKLNPRDWVTISKGYAVEHGKGNLGKYRIISKTVPARTLFTAGDSIQEWGYNP